MPKFKKGNRVKVLLTSLSPYRGQTGIVDDDPSPASDSGELWYMVRFAYKGLHPAVHIAEEDLEAVTEEITREETPAAVKLARRSRRETGKQLVQVSTKRRYIFGTLIAVMALAGALITFAVTGNNSPETPEFPSGSTNLPLLTDGSSNKTPRLVFAAEVIGARAGSPFAVQPVVKIVDSEGNIMTDFDVPVTLAVTNYEARLFGTATVNAVNGIATFTDLWIGLAGKNYSLTAISPGLTSGIGNSFDIEPDEGVMLAFVTQPTATGLNTRFTVQVVVLDKFGNLDTGSTSEVSLSITPGSGAPNAVLSGTTTQAAVNGIANFSYLSITPEDSDYTLTATSPGLESTTSYTFNIKEIMESQENQ